jgi:hypothetical protein
MTLCCCSRCMQGSIFKRKRAPACDVLLLLQASCSMRAPTIDQLYHLRLQRNPLPH